MDKIFGIEAHEDFQKAMKEMLEFYCSRKNEGYDSSCVNKEAKDELMRLLMASDFQTNTVSLTLIAKGWDKENISHFLNMINEKKTELLYATLVHQNCANHGETINGFDWVLKLVLGTSELNTLRCPILQLILMSTDSNGLQKKVVYDMNKEILLKAIDVLEQIDNKV